jgi:serine/threonine-protein kinase
LDGDPFGLLGTVLDGKFRVDALVGDGDLSVVYKGYHLGLHAPVAIKCLHLPDTLDPALTRPVVEAFEDAGQLQDRLGRGSRHIAQTIALGRTTAPRNGVTVPYRVREWFEGESLASDLGRRRRQGAKPRTVEEAFALLAPAIDGIAHAHEQGFAHLSLDPGNLFLDRDEGPSLKVLDFSTARASHRAEARPTLDSELTRGLHLLRPAYASPEQLDMDLGDPGPWTDVYSLALIMMEVLAERSDVEGRDTAALVERALDRHNRPTPQAHGLTLAPPLDLVLTRAVARSPRKRQQNARVFLNELKAALSQEAPAGAPSTPARLPQPKPAPLPAPPLPLSPSPAASGTVATGLRHEAPRIAPVVPPPSFFLPVLPHAAPDPAPLGREEKLVRRGPFARELWPVACAAGLTVAGIVVALYALLHGRQPSGNPVATPAPMAPSAVTSVTPPTATAVAPVVASVAPPAPVPVAPVAKAARTPAVAARPVAPGVAAPARTASPRAAAGAELPHFSRAAAQRAINSVRGKVRRCRHGRFWGNGYATVVFGSDGSVDRVLVDPPFSRTVAGKCVADAFGLAHMRSFAGRDGYYRLRFYIAPR